jgi:CBS-domain-containing membrane protein
MGDKNIHTFPVVDEKNELLGVVGKFDLIAALAT